jgi:hypothetical protein
MLIFIYIGCAGASVQPAHGSFGQQAKRQATRVAGRAGRVLHGALARRARSARLCSCSSLLQRQPGMYYQPINVPTAGAQALWFTHKENGPYAHSKRQPGMYAHITLMSPLLGHRPYGLHIRRTGPMPTVRDSQVCMPTSH